MIKRFEITNRKTKQHLGYVIAEKMICDPLDNYILFIDRSETVAMFPARDIEISTSWNGMNKVKEN